MQLVRVVLVRWSAKDRLAMFVISSCVGVLSWSLAGAGSAGRSSLTWGIGGFVVVGLAMGFLHQGQTRRVVGEAGLVQPSWPSRLGLPPLIVVTSFAWVRHYPFVDMPFVDMVMLWSAYLLSWWGLYRVSLARGAGWAVAARDAQLARRRAAEALRQDGSGR
ncbi:MAG: hypothetical protein ACYDH5_07320 [Acidimicrobiales bacterium]